MTGAIYSSKFEAMKDPHITWRRVLHMSNGEIGDNRKSIARVFAAKTNFWQNVSERQVNVTLMLAKCNLLFRGSSELLKDNKGNFLSIIQLLAKYDPVLDKLLQLSKGFSKYLSPSIQNELISVGY